MAIDFFLPDHLDLDFEPNEHFGLDVPQDPLANLDFVLSNFDSDLFIYGERSGTPRSNDEFSNFVTPKVEPEDNSLSIEETKQVLEQEVDIKPMLGFDNIDTNKQECPRSFDGITFSEVEKTKIPSREILITPPPTKRVCSHCEIEKTPQWREGPMGPKTLCNPCGSRYKTGRLFPEYRPRMSPTYDPSKHSYIHKNVLKLRAKNLSG